MSASEVESMPASMPPPVEDVDPSLQSESEDVSPDASLASHPAISLSTPFDASIDYRLALLSDLTTSSLNVEAQAWQAFASDASNIARVLQWLEKGEQGSVLLFHTALEQGERLLYLGGATLPDLPATPAASSAELPSASLQPTLYILKDVDRPITRPASAAQCDDVVSAFEYGVLPSHSLHMLQLLINDVFIPLAEPDAAPQADDKPSTAGLSRPSLTASQLLATPAAAAATAVVSDGVDSASADLASNLHKFSSQLTQAIQQAHSSITLTLPANTAGRTLADLSSDAAALAAIERAMDEWISVIATVSEAEQRKRAAGFEPLAEINFWRERNATLAGLYEQLQQPDMRLLIGCAEQCQLPCAELFEKHVADLLKLYVEAKDNVKFLVTLERHFKALQSGSLQLVQDTIPSMMNSLRMVWVISRHYNKDARMFPLMERIARTIADRVARQLHVRAVFRRQPSEAIRLINRGKDVLDGWHASYMAMRERIEQSGTDRRWEFNRAKLFDQTGYMLKICEHLLEVAHTVEQFSRFLGPELKAVTGDSHGIDDVYARVTALTRPLEHLSYNIFDPRNSTQWDDTMRLFHSAVDDIELKTKHFIDSSFQRLRSAEGAFDLLQNFKTMEARDSIQQQMMLKFTDILLQYSKEVERIKRIFEAGEHSPPVSKNQPPIAGAIAWTRALYIRIKKSVLRFQSMPRLLESEQGKAVCKEYVLVARAIHRYQERLIDGWRARVSEVAGKRLKEFIFRYEDGLPPAVSVGGYATEEKTGTVVPVKLQAVPGSSASSSSSSAHASSKQPHPLLSNAALPSQASRSRTNSSSTSAAAANSAAASRSYMRSSRIHGSSSKAAAAQQYALQHRRIAPNTAWIDRRILVNFSPELTSIIKETRYLDRLGVDIPPVARSVALQERKYYALCEQLQAVLDKYAAVVARLSSVEKALLCGRIAELHRVMAPGFDPINWNSLAIPAYIDACTRAISQLETLVNSVQKNSDLIHRLVAAVRKSSLVDAAQLAQRHSALSMEELNDRLEAHRSRQVDELLTRYRSMGPLLRIIEMHVCETESGRADDMYEYYRYWEKKMFMAATAAIASGMRDFQSLLLRRQPAHPSLSSYPVARALPLISVVAEMSPPSMISVTPNIQDIYKLLSKLLRNIPESSKHFIRWMAGTCVECEPISVGSASGAPLGVGADEEVVLYTFYDDLSKNPLIVPLMLTVTQSIQRTVHAVDRFVDSFAQYHAGYQLWNPKKLAALERFRTKTAIPTAYFDRQLDKYSQLVAAMDGLERHRDIDFIRLDCTPLIASIQQQAREWVSRYGEILRVQATAQLHAIYADISQLAQRLSSPTDGIDELKFVLNVIRDIRQSNLQMELSFQEVGDKFSVLQRYQQMGDVADKDRQLVQQLHAIWASLMQQAAERDASLNAVKENFTSVTQQQIADFLLVVSEMRERFDSAGPGSDVSLEEGVELMKAYDVEVSALLRQKDVLATSEKLFGLAPTSFTDLYTVQERMGELHTLYALYAQHVDSVHKWSAIMWAELEVGVFTRGLASYTQQLKRLGERLSANLTFRKLHARMTAFKDSIPLLLSLKTDALRERHWKELMRSTGVKFDFDSKQFTLGALFGMELHRYRDDITRITQNAQQEAKIEKDIQKLAKQWAAEAFALQPFDGDESRGYILSDVSEILQTLEDHSLSLQAMANSPFAAPFLSELRGWEQRCNHIAETLSVWMSVQKKWMYLEGIFLQSDDIRMQLPEPAKKFDRVDLSFKKIMQATLKQPNVLTACQIDHRIDDLRALAQELDKCQKSLSDYLERKRHAFPRFFFISDDELLSILGQSSPLCVQVHMLKLFQSCKELLFSRGEQSVVGMSGGADEQFELRTPVSTEGAVEVWMQGVEAEMKATLRAQMKEAVFHYAASDRLQWIGAQLGMVSITGSQIWWTWEVENAFQKVRDGSKHAMKQLAAKLTAQLNELVAAIRDPNIDRCARKKLNTLIIIDVHARDIIDRFVRDSILDAREFDWESQLRFYWDRDADDVAIRQCTGQFTFGYEYMGLDARLVITPLTDRCYMTLTQALTFHMGGSPSGPAGTGKTETVKDLAKALGVACLVTNCGEGLDYRAMGSIFSGLVQTGAWGCFDEFNRIDVEVLSVVSSQLQTIQAALNLHRQRFEFQGKDISIRPSVGFFITMNPGYAGRTELPDNLKALFRPVTMIVPDLLQICEIMLFSEGFTAARALAKKMTVLYRLAAEQLSKQFHYDFGLRALKSVLVMAGALKRSSPELSEELVLMRALRDQNSPKFVFEDVPLFLGLISDLFPALDCPRVLLRSLKQAVVDDLQAQGYRHADEQLFALQVDKVIQLHETLATRHTVMIVGPTLGGKSVVLQTLARAYQSAFKQTTKLFTMNPKALSVSELYGTLDPNTRDWTDGLLSKIFRDCNEPLKGDANELRYLVFDGDVDALWVENMNSVMDDNKLLTLPNGERIRLEEHCKLLFEVADLQYASPATVSRCGMVYVDPKNLGYSPYYSRWVRSRCGGDGKMEELLTLLYDKYVNGCVEFVLDGLVDGKVVKGGACSTIIPVTRLAMVKQFCALFAAILPAAAAEPAVADASAAAIAGEAVPIADAATASEAAAAVTKNDPKRDPDVLESVYIFCLTWSIGGALTSESRARFDTHLKALSHRPTVQAASKSHLPEDSLYDFQFNLAVSPPRWTRWEAAAYQAPVPFEFSKVLVPTLDTTRYTALLGLFVGSKTAVLLVGETGTAKTVTINSYLAGLPAATHTHVALNFSSRTSSLDVQLNIESNVDKRTGSIFGPTSGRQMVVFVDDLNMPRVDAYGTQQPIALLRFLVERGHMYDRGLDDSGKTERLARKTFKDLLYVAAMAPPGGGRNAVDPRFVSLFSVVSVTFPSDDSLQHIYRSMLHAHFEPFPSDVRECGIKLTSLTLRLYRELCAQLPPTPSKFHYVFNLRDLSRVMQGVMLSTPERFSTAESVVRLWRNECMRVFHDRLITDADKALVRDKLLAHSIAEQFPSYKQALAEPLLFGDFKADGRDSDAATRLYGDLGDYTAIAPHIADSLAAYNEDNDKPMDLVLFEAALEHLTRILRIIRRPRGNALLVGVGGSGKQSLTRLAAWVAGYRLFTISLTRNYGESDFREDIKSLYTSLALGNVSEQQRPNPNYHGHGPSPIVFLFTDAHVKDESFLELVNNMLTSGMVPALFSDEEKQPFIDSVRGEVKAAGLAVNSANCWAHFVSKCADNLHLVLCFSPAGDTLRRRCRSFPGLVNNTVIDWFFPWPETALQAVADKYLSAEPSLSAEERSGIVGHMVKVHSSVLEYSAQFELELRRLNSVTPKNYLDYIANYRSTLTSLRDDNVRQFNRLDGGLTKLIDAGEAVEKYGVELAEKKVVVDAKSKECALMIGQIKERSREVESKQHQAAEREAQLVEDNSRIMYEKEEAEKALLEAEPELAAAAEALLKLKKEDIAEVKVLQKPPISVQLVCQCVLELRPLGNEDPSQGWAAAKAMMNDANFLLKLKTYPKDGITDKQIGKVVKILKKKTSDPKQKLTLENLQRISRASAGLLQWVLAIVNYNRVAKNVEPRRLKLRAMEKAKVKAEEDLLVIQSELQQLQTEITTLRKTYTDKSEELRELEDKALQMEKHLSAASQLINGLSSEKVRWAAEKEKLLLARSRLVGDCLLAAAFLSYTGAFTFDYRRRMIYEDWLPDCQRRCISLTTPYRLEALLTSEVEVSKWASEGLPADELSIQNGMLTTKSTKFPLCIDPQMQAARWIKQRCAKGDKELKVRSFNDSDWMRQLELALQFGNPYVLEGVQEELDPVMDPILDKQLISSGGGFAVQLGDNTVDWNTDFRLYIVSKLANPKYSPEVAGKVMIINYSVTRLGLEDQLLNVVVGLEREDLQSQREELIQTISRNNITLSELEDNILRELNSAQGNLLDNHVLIATLKDAKAKTLSIAEQLLESRATADEIEAVTNSYRPIAKRGALLFFAMSAISAVSSMYEFSLTAYLDVFRKALIDTPRQPTVPARVDAICALLTRAVYDYTCTGIFERHKLMFSVQMCTTLLDGAGQLNRDELDFFLKGNLALDKIEQPKPADWIPDAGWKDMHKLVELGKGSASSGGKAAVFADFLRELDSNLFTWKEWYDLERPEEAAMPNGLESRLTAFQRLLVLRCFRPDRVLSAVKSWVCLAMGDSYFVQPPVLKYERVYAQSTCSAPVVFILSPGADPLSQLITLGRHHGYFPAKFKSLALGQGQAKAAERLLEQGYHRGHWIVLENLHLMKSWLKQLEKLLSGLTAPHKDFRLFLTTNPTGDFPLGILQNALKVVTEPPDGLRMNMKATYSRLAATGAEDECSHRAYRPLVFVLAFFHAVIQERRKYGKWGWNVPYDFNDSDFDVSRRLLAMYLTKASAAPDDVIPWSSLRYLIGECMYGGRVTDSYDRRIRTGHDYALPAGEDSAAYAACIESLPLDNSPLVFGLHSNAEIRYNSSFVKEIWAALTDLQPRVGSVGSGVTREEYIGGIAVDILAQLPDTFDLPACRRELVKRTVAQQSRQDKELKKEASKAAKKKKAQQETGQADEAAAASAEAASSKKSGAVGSSVSSSAVALPPTTIVLLQELERFNALTSKMRDSLTELCGALRGLVGMSAELDAVSQSLMNGQLPDSWRRLAPATEKGLGSWMAHYQRRHAQYKEWAAEGVEPRVMWLAGLHIPESYLTALVQTTCRRKRWPLDKSTLYTKVTPYRTAADIAERPADGCFITGLYLEGAAWSDAANALCSAQPKVLIDELPILQVMPIEHNKLKLLRTFKTPVYVTQGRRSAMGVGCVFEADLDSGEHASHWILQGAALVLNNDS